MVRVLMRAAGLAAATWAFVALTAACAPNPLTTLPRGDWELVAAGPTIRYYTLRQQPPRHDVTAAVARLEAFLADVGRAWYVPEALHYYAFPNRDALRALTGWEATGRAILDRDAVVSVHAADAHEVAHVLSAPHGRPLRLATFWLEGIAMYYTWPEVFFGAEAVGDRPRRLGTWYGRSVHAWAQEARRDGVLPPLAGLVHGNEVWRTLEDDISYPLAGSFTTFLVGPGHRDFERIGALRSFFDEANVAATREEVERSFERHFGLPLHDVEAAWLAFLDAWEEPDWGS